MLRGIRRTLRPSGYQIKSSLGEVDAGGSIPPNVIEEELSADIFRFGNNLANDPYTKRCKEAGLKIQPGRFPSTLPKFF
jgi:hypothetical protein